MKKVLLLIDGILCFACFFIALVSGPVGPGVEAMYIVSYLALVAGLFVLGMANFIALEEE